MNKRSSKKSSQVNFYNLTTSQLLPLSRLKKKSKSILEILDLQGHYLDVHLVTDSKIKKINANYLGHDYATDVIAFGQQEGEGYRPLILERPFLGDIVISVTTARREARLHNHSFEYELFFYLVHGLLHLKGFEDKTSKQRQKMHEEQSRILEMVKIGK